ncbi:MAG: DEAD/DEAH box helicase [Microthrixaceae bacterium]|nr:DEAD/DEAH box helicase [Microthrixaceae bacterium]
MSASDGAITPDEFQLRAIEAIDAGESVLVAAPTGAGKTLVAEHAIERALAQGRRAFYTTPIKALSNQKFRDFSARWGSGRVGLLTGDNAHNGSAAVVVMTTEVLRNMIYVASPNLAGLGVVVMDEVHYLADPQRGPTWEEVIIHAPAGAQLVALSATVSNSDQLGDWIRALRGPTRTVIEHERPVELRPLYLVGDRSAPEDHLLPMLVDGRPNPEGPRFDPQRPTGRRGGPGGGRGRRSRFGTPRKVETVRRLDDEGLLPAIWFIFSRNGCDEAMAACRDAGIGLTSPEERAIIRSIVESHTASLSADDLRVLRFDRTLAAMEAGIAAHHAGMVPSLKEAVEEAFVLGLIKVVFATETLALGINMPARTVVIDKLTKFTGDGHDFLTPAQFTQLTGRAGRRGIDELGFAVVAWSPFVTFEQAATLAASREYPLRSAFRPTYNMVANLVGRYDRDEALGVLQRSFAQFQADADLVRLRARLDRLNDRIEEAERGAACDRGEVGEYATLLAAERAARPSSPAAGPGDEVSPEVTEAVGELAPGEVIEHPQRGEPVVVMSVAHRSRGRVRLRVADIVGRPERLTHMDFVEEPTVVGNVDLPVPYRPETESFAQEAGVALQRMNPRRRSTRRASQRPEAAAAPTTVPTTVPTAAPEAPPGRSEDHPVAECPRAAEHLAALDDAARLGRDAEALRRRIAGRDTTLERGLTARVAVLEARGYLDGWALTPSGRRLARIYHEADLAITHALETGLLDGLDAPELAGLVSVFTYEHRSSEPPPEPRFPNPLLRRRYRRIEQAARQIHQIEESFGLPPTRAPDPGMVEVAYAWVAGAGLADVVGDDLSGGDFVRWVRQLIDLTRQIAEVTDRTDVAAAAREAVEGLHRGVVSTMSDVTVTDDLDDLDDQEGVDEGGGGAPR